MIYVIGKTHIYKGIEDIESRERNPSTGFFGRRTIYSVHYYMVDASRYIYH
jgi:hypothetical protein